MFCNKCGAELERDAQFCSMCGSVIEADTNAEMNIACKNESRRPAFRRLITITLAVLLAVSCTFNLIQLMTSRNKTETQSDEGITIDGDNGEYDNLINKARNALKSKWMELYNDNEEADGYLEIYHTRIVDITPDKSDTFFQELDRGMEIDYVIEFSIYSDYFSSAPYYFNAGTYDTVIVYNDGTTSVASNFFRVYSNLTYSYDYSGFIAGISDLGIRYNQIFHLN